jgi:hypothetical protein
VEGDYGAPLEEDELEILKEIYPEVKPYLSEAGIKAIEKQGTHVLDEDGDLSTPTIKGRECAYAIYDDKKVLKCGIEQAYLDGKDRVEEANLLSFISDSHYEKETFRSAELS